MNIDNEPDIIAETGASYQASGNNQPKVKEGRAKKGKKFIKISGEYQQAEAVRQKYLDAGAKVGLLIKDKFNEGGYIFFVDEEPRDQDRLAEAQVVVAKEDSEVKEDGEVAERKDKEQLVKELKEFRLMRSRKENIAAYLIFNNEEMEALISAYPVNEEELLKVKGFGMKKVEKYGEAILRIFRDNRN